MTGSNTDPVSIPTYVTASAVLLRLASPFFYRAIEHMGNPERIAYEAWETWETLRGTAQLLLERGTMQLTQEEGYKLRDALEHCPFGSDRDFIEAQTFTERG
jgi:hypothetical protein